MSGSWPAPVDEDFWQKLREEKLLPETILKLEKNGCPNWLAFCSLEETHIEALDILPLQKPHLKRVLRKAKQNLDPEPSCSGINVSVKDSVDCHTTGAQVLPGTDLSSIPTMHVKVEKSRGSTTVGLDTTKPASSPHDDRELLPGLRELLKRAEEERRRQHQPRQTDRQESPMEFGRQEERALDSGQWRTFLEKVEDSVGMIKQGEQALGTGFRVGKDRIMTCLHVVKKEGTQSELRDNLRIVFGLTSKADKERPDVNIMKEDMLHDVELDVAILKIDGTDRLEHCCPLRLSKTAVNGPLHLVGHPSGNLQMIDPSIERVHLPSITKEFVFAVDGYFRNLQHICILPKHFRWPYNIPEGNNFQPPQVSFEGLLNENFQIIHTAFVQGASGSPGVAEDSDGHMTVGLMLRAGYPEFYHALSDEMRKRHPMPSQKYRFELGLVPTKLYERMCTAAQTEENWILIKEIFN